MLSRCYFAPCLTCRASHARFTQHARAALDTDVHATQVLDRRLLFKDSTFFDVPEDFYDLNADVSDEEEQEGAEPANGGNSKLEIAV